MEKLNTEEKNKQAEESSITAQASITSNYGDDDEVTLTKSNPENSTNYALIKKDNN